MTAFLSFHSKQHPYLLRYTGPRLVTLSTSSIPQISPLPTTSVIKTTCSPPWRDLTNSLLQLYLPSGCLIAPHGAFRVQFDIIVEACGCDLSVLTFLTAMGVLETLENHPDHTALEPTLQSHYGDFNIGNLDVQLTSCLAIPVTVQSVLVRGAIASSAIRTYL